MFYIKNSDMTVHSGVGGLSGDKFTAVSIAAHLDLLFSAAQLNKLAQVYLGRTFNKVSRVKMAAAIFPAVERAIKKTQDDAELAAAKAAPLSSLGEAQTVLTGPLILDDQPTKATPSAKVPRADRQYELYSPVHALPTDAKVAPQLRKLYELMSSYAADQGDVVRLGFTVEGSTIRCVKLLKSELLQVLKTGGFISRGDPWRVVMFYRRALINYGVMGR